MKKYKCVNDVVWRIGKYNDITYIQLTSMKKPISLTTSNFIEIALLKEGDSVMVKFLESNNSYLIALEFQNKSNPIKLSTDDNKIMNKTKQNL